jgi:hypothetical protein
MNIMILFFQYQVYSSSLNEKESTFSYSQEISVTYRDNRFYIVHTFHQLPENEITITWPLQSENRACFMGNGDSCTRLVEDLHVFKEGKASEQQISYEIPVKDSLTQPRLFKGVFASLLDGSVDHSMVHVTDVTKSNGLWLTGLPAIGKESLSLVDYKLFNGDGGVSDLYWQKDDFPAVYKDHLLSIYSNQPISEATKKTLNEIKLADSNHVAVIVNNKTNEFQANRFVFIPTIALPNVKDDIILRSVQSGYSFSANATYSLEVMASFLTNQTIGSEKSMRMYDNLMTYMTTTQIDEWKDQLRQLKGQAISPKLLDSVLSKTLNQKTSFFELNEQLEEKHFPLLFEDTRTVYINELEQNTMKVIFNEGRVLYSVEPMLSLLGYTTEKGQNGYYIKNAARAFRFPMMEPFYVFNERRYEVLSQPIEELAGDYYIEESWLVRLFLVDIQKEERRINITPSAQF